MQKHFSETCLCDWRQAPRTVFLLWRGNWVPRVSASVFWGPDASRSLSLLCGPPFCSTWVWKFSEQTAWKYKLFLACCLEETLNDIRKRRLNGLTAGQKLSNRRSSNKSSRLFVCHPGCENVQRGFWKQFSGVWRVKSHIWPRLECIQTSSTGSKGGASTQRHKRRANPAGAYKEQHRRLNHFTWWMRKVLINADPREIHSCSCASDNGTVSPLQLSETEESIRSISR